LNSLFNSSNDHGSKLDQMTHSGPETYAMKILDRISQVDEKCDAIILDLMDAPQPTQVPSESVAMEEDPARMESRPNDQSSLKRILKEAFS
jgi:hypothetical protein